MIRAHQIRLNPTPDQERYFRKATGTARFVFNWALSRWKEYRAQGKSVSMHNLKKEFNQIKGERFPWVYEVTKCAAEQEFNNLGAGLSNFFRLKKEGKLPKLKQSRRDGEEAGFPHYKSKRDGPGSFYVANDKFSVEGQWIRIPKLGKVNLTESLRFLGKILSATISYRAGWWWVAITVDIPRLKPQRKPLQAIGVDVGLKGLATVSSGEVVENQKHLKRRLRQIKRLQRTVSRSQKGSRNRAKAVLRLAKAYFKVACARQDATHKLTTWLVRQAAIIGIEDLNVAGMLKNHRLAGSISDTAWSEIRRQLTYKAPDSGSRLIVVNRFFPSSQFHNGCGGRKTDLTLRDRVWVCPTCRQDVDRDLNAALNLRDEALRLNTVSGSGYIGDVKDCLWTGDTRVPSVRDQDEAGTIAYF